MSDTASSSGSAKSSSVSHAPGERSTESSATDRVVVNRPPDDQPTIITNRPPLTTASSSDSNVRVELNKLEIGDRLDHFELVEYVGGGGMGRVFRALDTRLSRAVALKVLPPQQAGDSESLLRFRNEARSAARLDHESIAQVYFVGEDRGLPYIVFEYIEGMNIRRLVEHKGPLPLGEAVSYTLQVADALTHAAASGVVHRDIKPSNVLVTPEGRVKVIDMGLARLEYADGAATDLTASGVTLGTFDYISPEQARDPRTVDVRSDIYSLGCTFFYMLTGRPPFPEGTVLQKLLQHQGDEPPSVRQFRPGLPEEVSAVLRRMLAKNRGRRYQDPTQLVEHLVALAERVGLQPIGPGRRVWMAPPEPKITLFQRHLPWVAPIAALVCIVVFLDFLWSPPPEGNQLSPALIGQNEDFVPELPLPDAIPTPKTDAGPEGTSSTAPEQPAKKDTASATTAAPAENGTSTAPSAVDQPSPPRPDSPAPATVPAVTAESNPLGKLTAKASGEGLRPEGEQGGMSVADPESSGLRAAPAERPDEVELTVAAPREAVSGGNGASSEAPKRSGVLVVNDGNEGEGEFGTLAAATSAAASGDVIELRYNGRREEKPIALARSRVTIRAGEGFKPVVVFRPSEPDPVKCPRAMFTLSGVRLTLVNVALELEVPRNVPAQKWSLFEAEQTEKVRLEKCSLTIRNASDPLSAYHQDVAFFRFRAAPGADGLMRGEPTLTEQPVRVELLDCIARGQAVFAKLEHSQPIDVSWENGLLATTERFFQATGSERTPQPGETIRIDLQHMTALVQRGFCQLVAGQFDTQPLPTSISCADSILITTTGRALIEQEGGQSKDEFHNQFAWSGDRNVYQGFDVFWRVIHRDSKTPAEQMSFETWQAYWGPERENLPNRGLPQWRQLPDSNKPLDARTVADYALRQTVPANPAIGAASDGRDIGAIADRLPRFPAEPEPAGPPTP